MFAWFRFLIKKGNCISGILVVIFISSFAEVYEKLVVNILIQKFYSSKKLNKKYDFNICSNKSILKMEKNK